MRVPNSTFTAPRDTGGGPQTEGAEQQASEQSVETEALCQSGQTGSPHSVSCGNLEEGEKGPGGWGGGAGGWLPQRTVPLYLQREKKGSALRAVQSLTEDDG